MYSAIASIFLLMLAGYIARRTGIVKASDVGVVRAIVTGVTAPAFIFSAIYAKPINTQMMIAPIVHFAALLVVLALAYSFARLMKLDKPTTGGLMLASAFGNTAFLGYPVIIAAFPHNNLALPTGVMVDQIGMTAPLYSLGIAIAAGFGSKHSNKYAALGFLKSPLFISMVLVFILRTVHLPEFIVTSGKTGTMGVLNYLGGATVPLAMMSLGMSITRVPLKSFLLPFVVVCGLKFIMLPLLSLMGANLFGLSGIVRDVTILQGVVPTAIMASVLAGRYGSNGQFVSAMAFTTTLMSVVLIPAFLTLIH